MFKVGVLSDTHINSTHCDYKSLEQAVKELSRDVDVVLHAGDLIDGRRVYTGQDYFLESLKLDDMVQKAGDFMSKVKRPAYWIGGNHDYSLLKHFGVDLSKQLQSTDWQFLGWYVGDKELDGKKFRLLHPAGGSPYSISYTAQKYLRNLDLKKEGLDWLILGHLHKPYFFESQGVNVLGSPSFQKLNDFGKRRGYGGEIGYWIITFNKNGDYKLFKRVFNK